MVALAILTLIGGLMTVQVKKLIDTHRFEGEVATLFIALQEAQVFAATYQTDLALELSLKSGTLSYRFSTDEPFPLISSNRVSFPCPMSLRSGFRRVKLPRCTWTSIRAGALSPEERLVFIKRTTRTSPSGSICSTAPQLLPNSTRGNLSPPAKQMPVTISRPNYRCELVYLPLKDSGGPS